MLSISLECIVIFVIFHRIPFVVSLPIGETGGRWDKRQVGIAFRLSVYSERNNGKVTVQNISFIIKMLFPKFYLNQTSITIKRKRKNLIQEEASKFLSVSKFRIDVLQLERANLSDRLLLLIKRKVSVTVSYFK